MFNLFKNNIEKYYQNLVRENKNDIKLLYGINSKYRNQENRLLEMFGKCDLFDKKIKMIIISDTHGCLREDEFSQFINENKQFDVCLLLGDHSIGDIEIILRYVNKEKYMLY